MSKIIQIVCSLVFTLGVAVLQYTPVSAEAVPKYFPQVSPVQQDLGELEPGGEAKSSIKVTNIGSEEFKFELEVVPFSIVNERYEYDLSRQTNYTKISKWIEFPERHKILKPGESAEMEFIVKVPEDVPAGGQYAVVQARVQSSKSTIQEIVAPGMKVLARVKGQTRVAGQIFDNKMNSLYFQPPVEATSVIENTGNVDLKVKYHFEARNFFNGQLAYTSEADEKEPRYILPETKMVNTSAWRGAPQLGIFKVKHVVSLQGVSDSVVEKTVLILPIWLIVVVFTLIFFSIFWLISRQKARKATK